MTVASPRVLFIGGTGRSGSTLLELLLAQERNYVPVGELRQIWSRGVAQNQLCSCGSQFHDCPFWGGVMYEVFGGIDRVPVHQILERQHRVDRLRYAPAILLPILRTREFRRLEHEHVELLEAVIRAILSVSGGAAMIDSSKDASHGFLLSKVPGIRLDVIHLIRDPRGVAFSRMRVRKRPEVHWKLELMPRFSIPQSTFLWAANNLLTESQSRLAHSYSRCRYEDLVRNPETTLEAIFRNMGEPPPQLGRREESGKAVRHGYHSVAGNPLRFRTGDLVVRPDLEWRSQMRSISKALVVCLSIPLFKRYGYRVFD